MRLFASALLVSSALALPGSVPVRSDLSVVEQNDNRVPAGRLAGGELQLALEIRSGRWFPMGPDTERLTYAVGDSVHWHDLELDSPFDGVVGVGGMPGMPTPAIMPGDSFEVRITPPRAGSFMYHTHADELLQHSGGLWGAFLVMESGETYDDRVNLVPGEYALELRRAEGTLEAKVPVQVLAWQDPAVQIASAVLPLPEPLRATATVLGYRSSDGPLVELRKGSNGMICLADDPKAPAFHVACYHESMEPFMARGRQLRAEGVEGAEVDTVRFREAAAGTIKMPTLPAALWQLSGPPGSYDAATNTVTGARHLYVIYIPYATTETTGIPSIPSQDQPWLMNPGTPKAHIMFVPRM